MFFNKLHRQETRSNVGGRKPMSKIQATVAMEQWRTMFDIIVFAAAGARFSKRSNAMSTHQDLVAEAHTRPSYQDT